jgi:hypothetical protein
MKLYFMRIPRLRLLLSISVGGFALLFLLFAQPAFAREHPCGDPFDCLVPAPTLVQPRLDRTFSSPRAVVITGLSWNETKVDVYIDGIYNGRADLRTDKSDVGNFVYYPFLPLTPGKHTVYAVARNISEKERSPESPEISFMLAALQAKPASSANPNPPESSTNSATTTTSTVKNQNANSILDWFFNRQPGSKASTTSSTVPSLQSTYGRGAMIILIVIVFALIVLYFFRPKYEEPLPYEENKKDEGPPM